MERRNTGNLQTSDDMPGDRNDIIKTAEYRRISAVERHVDKYAAAMTKPM
jgi:hypothetical protein